MAAVSSAHFPYAMTMSTRSILCSLFLALAAACLALALLGGDEARAQAQAGAWTTNCSASHCTASVKVRTSTPGVPYAYQLRVSRYPDAKTELVLLTGTTRPADDAPIQMQVDAKAVAQLAPGSGYRRVGRSNTFVVADGETGALLRALRQGRQLRLSFRTASGSDEAAVVPLQGLDAALSRIGVKEAKAGSPPTAPVAQAAPAQPPAQPPAQVQAPRTAAGPKRKPRPAAASPAKPQSTEPAAARSGSAQTQAKQPPAAPTPTPAAPADDTQGELPGAALDGPADAQSASAPPVTAAPAQSVSVPRQFACQGNEPFWNLMIDGDTARFVSLTGSGDPKPVMLSGKLQATAESTGATYGWRGRSADGSSYGALIERRSCRDSMSDREGVTTFAYSATLAVPGGGTLQGCCNAGLSLDKNAGTSGEPSVRLSGLRGRAPEDWSRHLPDMLRAIDACLERTPGDGAYVTKAWPMNRGMVGVRTRNASVGWFECIAQQDGRAIDQFTPIDAKSVRIADEEKLLFVPAAAGRHDGNCFRHEQVLDEADRPLGWLTTNTCWRAPGAPVTTRN